MQKLPRLENRAPGVPTTTVTNEIAETVNAMQATIVTGQDDEARGGVAESMLILVRCTQTGGLAGNSTSPCSFTYTIKRLDDTTIAESVAIVGNGNRTLKAEMTAGTWGTAYRDASGNWQLLWVDEKFTQHNCT